MVWSGSWVAERLGVELVGDGELRELLGLALRRNPKRAHLLVSHVLGKHVPQYPSVVYGAGFELGRRVRELLGEAGTRRAVVLGYAETATGLGHAVADGLGTARYLHSTRRPVAGVARAGGFEESHSHATSHLLLPEDPELLAGDVGDAVGAGETGGAGEAHPSDAVLVLVDDEFSTGNTVLNTIRALHERYPRNRYVIVTLVDMRSSADRGRLAEFAAEIGARVDLVARNSGMVRLPDGVLEKGQALVTAEEAAQGAARDAARECAPGVAQEAAQEPEGHAGAAISQPASGAARSRPPPPPLHPGGPAVARRCARRRQARLHPRTPRPAGSGPPRHGGPHRRGAGRRSAGRRSAGRQGAGRQGAPRADPRLRGADVRTPAPGHRPGGPHRRRGPLLHHDPLPGPRG